MKKDFYEILGITKNADAAEIKKAYRKKALEFHPDKNPGDTAAEEKFKLAAEAYEVLSDSNKKAKYDQYGHQAFDGSGGFGGGGHGGMNMDDIFSQFGDIFGSAFGGGGGFNGGGGGSRRVKGSNLRIKVKLTLEEIANGVEKKVKVKRKVQAPGVSYKTCSTCNGQGQVMRVTNTILGRMQSASTCPTCGGSGQLLDKKPSEADSQGMILEEKETIHCKVQIRYRHSPILCKITLLDKKLHVTPLEEVQSVTPGQSAVFYPQNGEYLLMGGIIEKGSIKNQTKSLRDINISSILPNPVR